MNLTQVLLLAAAAAVLLYGAFVAALVVAGRREAARALARFVPDCLLLFRRLLADPRVPRRVRVLCVALLAYLAMPIDLVPDVVPIAGQLDDAIIVAFVLRSVLRASGPALVRAHWSGPPASLDLLLRLATGARSA